MHPKGLLEQGVYSIGPLSITQSILTSCLFTVAALVLAWISSRKLSQQPGRYQAILEAVFLVMYNAVKEVLPEQVDLVFPFIATLWIFILASNLLGIVPGLSSPTADLSVTSALALLTFLSVHWFGIRIEGLKKYLRHYIQPSPIILPFHLISEISRTLALAVRLFGNMVSLELTALIVLMVAGFLAPVPILMLHIIEALIQAYIFGMLALIYIAGGLQTQALRREKENLND